MDKDKKVVIELQDIKRDFLVGDETVHALRGISFKIYEGEFVTIMGKSGSGKSTLLNQLGCLDTPTSGEYILDGVPVREMSRSQRAILRNRKIGFIFQNYNLLPKTTAVENVELPLMYNPDVSAKERHQRAIEALQAVGLGDRLYHKSNQMSGGQMQRVAIARALVNDPAVILADEATGNLDTRTSFQILVLFQKLRATRSSSSPITPTSPTTPRATLRFGTEGSSVMSITTTSRMRLKPSPSYPLTRMSRKKNKISHELHELIQDYWCPLKH